MGRHLSFASEEAPAVAGSRVCSRRRIFVVGQRTYTAAIDPTLLAVLDCKMHLYRYLGIKRVPTQSATVQMMRMRVQQMSLKLIWMRVELFTGAAYEFFADLSYVMFG